MVDVIDHMISCCCALSVILAHFRPEIGSHIRPPVSCALSVILARFEHGIGSQIRPGKGHVLRTRGPRIVAKFEAGQGAQPRPFQVPTRDRGLEGPRGLRCASRHLRLAQPL